MAAPREIVVGYDGSAYAIGALRRACALAGEGSHVTVLTAYRIPPEFHSYEFFEDLVGAMEGSAEELWARPAKLCPMGRSR